MRPQPFRKCRFDDACDALAVFEGWRTPGPGVLLESARLSPKTGRWSIIAKDPFLIFEAKGRRVALREGRAARVFSADPFVVLAGLLRRYAVPATPGLPPFTGGAVGFVGYEAKRLVEPGLFKKASHDTGLPDLYFPFFREAIVLDHAAHEAWLFGRRPDRLEAIVKAAGPRNEAPPAVAARETGRTFSRRAFIEGVEKAKRYIRQGEIFQANLSQRFSFRTHETATDLYARLRRINPSPFFGILDGGAFQIVSGSPERLVRMASGLIETRPIAGTRARGRTPREDAAQSLDLLLSEKERAEHIMLVDLERNDMGRVAEYGSVHADELLAIEDYSHVKHIVSNVRGCLRAGLGAVDVLKAFFPGGTITGAPKVRCMQILEELEPVARGPYTGSLGYFSFSGDMDLNILIRSLVMQRGFAHLQVGAGIVADSDPEKEYDETLHKAQALREALVGQGAVRGRRAGGALLRVS
jgi:para-aminobenzoate synthetase component 1